MSPELAGLLCSAVILVPTLIFVVVRTRESLRANTRRYAAADYTIYRNNAPFASGHTYRSEDWTQLDPIAKEILKDWFDTDEGYDATRGLARYDFCLVLRCDGRVGQAWG